MEDLRQAVSEWISHKEQSRQSDQCHQQVDEYATSRDDGATTITTSTTPPSVTIKSPSPDRLGPIPFGAKPHPQRRRRVIDNRQPEPALQNPTATTEVIPEKIVEKRLELASSLNEIYTKFSSTSERNRSKALRQLERDLARLGGSISACGMTGEVKDFVATLLMFEKVLPTEEGDQGTAESAIEHISKWLRGEGDMEGEFDAARQG